MFVAAVADFGASNGSTHDYVNYSDITPSHVQQQQRQEEKIQEEEEIVVDIMSPKKNPPPSAEASTNPFSVNNPFAAFDAAPSAPGITFGAACSAGRLTPLPPGQSVPALNATFCHVLCPLQRGRRILRRFSRPLP